MVSGSLSANEESERKAYSPFLTYTEQFYEVFPYYLSIGMSYDQFWNDDVNLVKYYRKADELKVERKNQEMWLQGLYIYEALCDVAPIMHAFAKKGTKAQSYSEKPYSITERQRRLEEEEKERKIAQKGKMMMEMFMRKSKGERQE